MRIEPQRGVGELQGTADHLRYPLRCAFRHGGFEHLGRMATVVARSTADGV